MTAVKEVKFPYADMHGNLKIVLKTPISNRYGVKFKTKEDIGQNLASLGTDRFDFFLERSLVLVIQYHYLIKFLSCLTCENYFYNHKNFTAKILTTVRV